MPRTRSGEGLTPLTLMEIKRLKIKKMLLEVGKKRNLLLKNKSLKRLKVSLKTANSIGKGRRNDKY
jgi:hypothetical protein